MATKKKTTTKRPNPADLTARNLKALTKRLDRHERRLEARERFKTHVGLLGTHLAMETGRVAVLEEVCRRLTERMNALEAGWAPRAVEPVSPTEPPAVKRPRRPAKVTPEEAAASTEAPPVDFTPPGSKAARRKGAS